MQVGGSLERLITLGRKVDAEVVFENIRNHWTGGILCMRESKVPPFICVDDV